jgi:bifunctional non-homologous end joining protein LigD
MPHHVKPMLATLTDEPFDDPDWIYEIKHDGYRAIAEINSGEVELYSRNLNSFNLLFHPVVESLEGLNYDMILDGEIVIVDEDGRSRFQLIQNYQRTGKGALYYFVFDLLYYDGYDLRDLPLLKRKELLEKALPDIHNVKYSDHITGRGKDFYQLAQAKQLEGIIAKKSNSQYLTGKRTRDWLKMKLHSQQEAIICGYTKPKGSRKHFGALILGVYKEDELVYIGHSGGGFDDKNLESIKKKLDALVMNKSPFKEKVRTNSPVTWVKPELVCEVSFSEWTDEGLMRHPVFLGLRDDKKPSEVQMEVPDPEVKEEEPVVNGGEEVDKEVRINRHKLKLTNLDKVFFPDEGYTKGDIIEYYRKVSKYMLPYLKDRPESMLRHPNGIYGKSFFQKNIEHTPPEWIKTERIYSEHTEDYINYLICNDEATLVFMANLGCIEINPWFSRVQSQEYPDYLVIDLDPEEISFNKVIETALQVKEALDIAGAKSFCKTSGATGIHVYVPLKAKYHYDVAKEFALVIGKMVNTWIPEFTSLERSPSKRKKKVYLDYLQNRKGQTLAAPYSVRPKPGATVSTPLKWEEVKEGLHPSDFTIKNIHKRLDKTGDLFKGVLGPGIDIEKCIKRIEKWKD